MNTFRNIYRRLDLIQRSMAFKIAASAIIIVGCGVLFGSLVMRSHSLYAQRQALYETLLSVNLTKGDEAAVSLKNAGTVFLNGRTYGGKEFLNPRVPLFDEAGNIADPQRMVLRMLADQRPAWAPDWLLDQPDTTLTLGLVFTAWLLLIVWMEISLPFVLTALGTAIPVLICRAMDRPQGMLAFAGIGLLTFTFVLLSRTALLVLNRPWQAPAVAHTVIKEASRTRLSLVFIVVLLVALPLIPLTLDPASPLRYRVQTFISLSLGLTFLVAACMTLVLSCASVAFEIRDRQIWQLMTKPLGRLNYVVGKWLGVMTINLIILAMAGVSIFMFIQYMRTLAPVGDQATAMDDYRMVRDEVLTARLGSQPQYETLPIEDLRKRVEQVIQADPDLSAMVAVPLEQRLKISRDIEQAFSTGQRTVTAGGGRDYTFKGLGPAKQLGANMTLRYRFHILSDDEHRTFKAAFVFNGDVNNARQARYVPTVSHSIPLSPSLIDDNGELKVTIVNRHERQAGDENAATVGALNFEADDFELLYKVSSFEGNFVRAVLLIWVKLAFLSAVGVGCATFLSFPVACLLSFTVFIGGMIGPFLAEALQWYYPQDTDKVDWSHVGQVLVWLFETCTRAVAQAMVFLLSSFGELNPRESLVEGRLIPWSAVGWGALKLGVLWSGLALGLGWLVLRKRQLAIYSGQG